MNRLYLIFGIAFLLVACQKPTESNFEPTYHGSDSATLMYKTPQSQIISQEENSALDNRSLAISGEIRFQTTDVIQANTQLEALTLKHSGYIQTSQIANEEESSRTIFTDNQQIKQLISYTRSATVVVRIPKQNVTEFLADLSPLIEFLDYRNFLAEDVKLDIQRAKLQAKIYSEKQESLKNNDIKTNQIKAAEQTASAKEEQLYAQLEKLALEDKVNFTTLTLRFYETPKITHKFTLDIDNQLKKESNYHFFEQLKNSLVNGWYYFLQFILFVSQFWLFILMVFAGLYAIYKYKKQRKKSIQKIKN